MRPYRSGTHQSEAGQSSQPYKRVIAESRMRRAVRARGASLRRALTRTGLSTATGGWTTNSPVLCGWVMAQPKRLATRRAYLRFEPCIALPHEGDQKITLVGWDAEPAAR